MVLKKSPFASQCVTKKDTQCGTKKGTGYRLQLATKKRGCMSQSRPLKRGAFRYNPLLKRMVKLIRSDTKKRLRSGKFGTKKARRVRRGSPLKRGQGSVRFGTKKGNIAYQCLCGFQRVHGASGFAIDPSFARRGYLAELCHCAACTREIILPTFLLAFITDISISGCRFANTLKTSSANE